MSNKLLTFALLSVTCTALGACKKGGSSSTEGATAVIKVPPVAPGQYKQVVQIRVGIRIPGLTGMTGIALKQTMGTAVNLGNGKFLTAGHVVAQDRSTVAYFELGEGVKGDEHVVRFDYSDIEMHPLFGGAAEYTAGHRFTGNDLAFVTIKNVPPGADSANPANAAVLNLNGITLGEGIPVGYGQGMGPDGIFAVEGTKRAGKVALTEIKPDQNNAIKVKPIGEGGPGNNAGMWATGDSGGALFAKDAGTGNLVLVGIIASGDAYGGTAINIDAPSNAEFIRKYVSDFNPASAVAADTSTTASSRDSRDAGNTDADASREAARDGARPAPSELRPSKG